MKNLLFLILSVFVLTISAAPISPHSLIKEAREGGGAGPGGGGDYTETVVNDIRLDILKWISELGASRLFFPKEITLKSYTEDMNSVLENHAVIIGSITAEEEQKTEDPDLKVSVEGQPKTCRGSIWKKDGQRHILCIIERFLLTPENERYPLVHHEYAGFAGVEQNIGASSDYMISMQISGFLEKKEVLRLTVKPTKQNVEDCNSPECVEPELADQIPQGSFFVFDKDIYLPPHTNIIPLNKTCNIGVGKSSEGRLIKANTTMLFWYSYIGRMFRTHSFIEFYCNITRSNLTTKNFKKALSQLGIRLILPRIGGSSAPNLVDAMPLTTWKIPENTSIIFDQRMSVLPGNTKELIMGGSVRVMSSTLELPSSEDYEIPSGYQFTLSNIKSIRHFTGSSGTSGNFEYTSTLYFTGRQNLVIKIKSFEHEPMVGDLRMILHTHGIRLVTP